MNHSLASELGYFKYISKRFIFRVKSIFCKHFEYDFTTGSKGLFPFSSGITSDLYLLGLDIDWGSELLFVEYLKNIKTKGTFVDVGANIGYYSILISPLVDQVVAFEPNSNARQWLSLNAIQNKNIEVVDKVVSDSSGFVSFEENNETELSSIILSGENNKKECISLDLFFENRKEVSIQAIKIDVEGFDFTVIKGASHIIDEHRPVIVTEFSVSSQNNLDQLEDYCFEKKYQIMAIVKDRTKTHLGKKNEIFKRMNTIELRSDWFKMLFLVPEENCFFTSKLKD